MAIDKVGAIGGAAATPALEPSGKAGFGKVLEGVKGPAKHLGPRVATEGAPQPVSAERTDAARGTCKAEGVGKATAGTAEVQARGRVDSVQAARSQHAVQMLDRVSEAQKRMDHILALAESGRSFSPNELLALQAQVYRSSQELDLAGKVVEKATGGVKQVLQTQV
ncbi:ATP-dependent helicase HrpB [Vitiosangium sp. GDMCC 1.1324]|uniref:ATP-dependent helicase HrpB n=1 Tax=Vitiosangium sp. (strain GDMCC 1.1324) TaxID=2138576 RepID=UPI000D36083D|nr:ATP-dependent helicase HrpB [Vitiosangium sp. GDMCC 1.1324]PTL78404.1 ATP-dependent helicase HrpB [Vitiosangium sp. GDMCC 1.1324]